MAIKTKNVVQHNSRLVLASVLCGAVLAASRPSVLTRVYAASNVYEWIKVEDLDRFGGDYTSVASSSTGSHLMLSVTEGGEGMPDQINPLYISSNHGASWVDAADIADDNVRNVWTSVDVSNDGQTMIASSNVGYYLGDLTDGKIILSENGGGSWNDITPVGTADWREVVVSGDGSKIAAIEEGSQDVYISADGGDNWTTTDHNPDSWVAISVSISDDGDKILVGGENGSINISTDGGDTWEDISLDDKSTLSHAISADGNKIAVSTVGLDNSNSVFISENWGDNWTESTYDYTASTYDTDIAMSDDGAVLSLLDKENNKMLITSDGGTSWNEEDPGQEYADTNYWSSVDINQDGSQIFVASRDKAYLSPVTETAPTVTLDDAEGGKTITLTTPSGTTITCHSAVKESDLSNTDIAYSYPLGLVDFCFSGADASNEVSLVFVTDLNPDDVLVRKYNPTNNQYATIAEASVSETTYEGKNALLVTYNIVDNGPLDLDPDDGEVADPVGLAIADTNALADTGDNASTARLVAIGLLGIGFFYLLRRRPELLRDKTS